jgi:cytochrome c peroxidase
MPRPRPITVLALPALLSLAACSEPTAFAAEILPLPADPANYSPLAGYAAMDIPADNPLTPEKAALGRQLYYDQRLSGDGSRSCYSCHVCEKGLTDGLPVAIGAHTKTLTRASPSLWNIGFHSMFYWDGRAPSLEKQAFAAWKGGNMGAGDDIPKIVQKLNATPGYQKQFQRVFGGEATADNVSMALAAYMRTIIGGRTAYDRWQAGDQDAVSAAAKRGHEVFTKAGCAECHAGKLFTDQVFHNVGIGFDTATGSFADEGRFVVSKADRDKGAFKTPTLRDIAESAPYFHDGSVATLEEAVRLMAKGGIANPHLDEKMKDTGLTEAEIKDLVEFLMSMDEECKLTAPKLPPEGKP